MSVNPTLTSYLAIAPEILLLILLFGVLAYNSFVPRSTGRFAGIVTAWGTTVILALTAVLYYVFWATVQGNGTPTAHWGGMIVLDPISVVFRVMFLLALLLTVLFSLDVPALQHAEYFALLMAATIGFNLMTATSDLIMLLIALETASIALYLLSGFMTRDRRSAEGGMKYFVYGAFASALMLYGMSFLYGLANSTNIYTIAQSVLATLAVTGGNPAFNGLLVLAAALLLAGFGFKVSVVPFHWWAPDVYEGAPIPVTGFLSTASKAAGFGLFIRVFTSGIVGPPQQGTAWWSMLVAICIITMVLGNVLAIYQTNIKRMLAYSSVAQAGYVMIGLVAFTPDAQGAALFYLLMYVLTNIAAFGVIMLVANVTGSDEMQDLYGLSRRSPYLGLAMLFALLSLGGIPPTAGFFGKFFIFKAAIEAGLWGLALAGILAAFVSLYYYLSVVKYIYLYRTEHDDVAIPVGRAAGLALGLSTIGIVYLGIFAGPAFEWTQNAARWFFTG